MVKVYGYDVIHYNESIWLKIFHHNSKAGFFKNKQEGNYSLDRNLFSILNVIDEKFKLTDGTNSYYSLIYEIPQIPQYIHFHQQSYFTDTNPQAAGFTILNKTGTWPHFGGIHVLASHRGWCSLYVCDDDGSTWNYPLGAIDTFYIPRMPFSINLLVILMYGLN